MRSVVSWIVLSVAVMTLACGPEPAASFQSVNNNPGTFDCDFTGDGGDVSESFLWTNGATRADFSMDITAATGGSVDVVIRDTDGTQVATFSLDNSSPDDTVDGVSSTGTTGDWTIEVTIRNFSGDGSLNVNAGT